MASTRFFTNDGENTLLKKFAGVFAHNPDIERFDALVGYLRASGYFALRPHLENVPQIRILVGIDVDKIVADYHRKGLLFLTDSGQTLHEFKDYLRRDIQSADYRADTERGILQFVEDVATGKLKIKAHPTKRLHAKIYIFRPKGFNEHKHGAVITGSSNLTGPGLGEGKGELNYEFNVLLSDYDDVQFASNEFEKLWDEGIDVLPAAIREGLEKDAAILEELVAGWEALDRDPKLDEFLVRLKTELFDPKLNHGDKLVIFSEARDTTNYLTARLAEHGYTGVLTVDSTNRKERMPVVRANFDANAPVAEQASDYHIIISTEVLAEGVNLHRANVIVNYDTPWNSTRLMQRIGRVNRIGTTAPAIHIFNFYPTARVDSHNAGDNDPPHHRSAPRRRNSRPTSSFPSRSPTILPAALPSLAGLLKLRP